MKPLPEVNLEELKEDKEENFRQRLAYLDAYVAWLKRTPNKVWSKQQKDIIG